MGNPSPGCPHGAVPGRGFVRCRFLYKQKVKDSISLMLISGIVTCVLEILWVVVDRHPALKVLAYLCVSGYCTAFVLFSALLNRYLLARMGIHPCKAWNIFGYVVPFAAIVLLCLTTAWTQLLFWVDESGLVHTMVFFDTFFQGIVYLYMFTPLVIALYFLTLGKNKRPAGGEIPVSLFVFGVMAPVLYGLELLLLGDGIVFDFHAGGVDVVLTADSFHRILLYRLMEKPPGDSI